MFFGGSMKKSLTALFVLLLSSFGANALASKLDFNIKRVVKETNDKSSSQNGSGDNSGGNMVTKHK